VAVIIPYVSCSGLHTFPIVLLSHDTSSSSTYLNKFPMYRFRQLCDFSLFHIMSLLDTYRVSVRVRGVHIVSISYVCGKISTYHKK